MIDIQGGKLAFWMTEKIINRFRLPEARRMLAILIYGMSIILIGPDRASGKSAEADYEESVDLAHLINNWETYLYREVVTVGKLHCLNTSVCDLLPLSGLRQTIFIELKPLDQMTINLLLTDCLDNECTVTVHGSVSMWSLFAWTILIIARGEAPRPATSDP